MTLENWIKVQLKITKGLTQMGLAEQLGVAPSAVSRMLSGARKIKVDELPVIETYLGARYIPEQTPPLPGGQNDNGPSGGYETKHQIPHYGGVSEDTAGYESMPYGARQISGQRDVVPVYGYAAGSLTQGLNLANGDVADWVPRHPAQFNLKGAFAVRTLNDSMEPRYYKNELIYVHPRRYPDKGQDCVVEMTNGDAYVKQYLGETDTQIRFGQLNPKSKFSWPKKDIKTIYAVVGRG